MVRLIPIFATHMANIFFWTALTLVIYTYLGYPMLLGTLVYVKRLIRPKRILLDHFEDLAEITLIIACFNEGEILAEKIQNTLKLQYPINKKKLYFVTDGSTDNSVEIIKEYNDEITLFHEPERKGKNAAVNRVMRHVKSPVTIFCDANTFLSEESLIQIARHYKDPLVGAVAGEKKVLQSGDAASTGEGVYWKYESKLKQWDSELNTVVGAAGELFSIRTSLYEEVPKNVLIEDFRLSMNIAKKGYKVVYEPEACAMEVGSESIEEERKRKVRISAGGLIEVAHFLSLLNFFKYGLLSFQYISHRMLRWTFAPLSLPVLLTANIWLVLTTEGLVYKITMISQIAFYLLSIVGFLLRREKLKLSMIHIPYYFTFMNLSVYAGLFSILKGEQTAVWEKAKRAVSHN